jgi:Tol biopolymer transport system component
VPQGIAPFRSPAMTLRHAALLVPILCLPAAAQDPCSCASLGLFGAPSDGVSDSPSISGDGRFIAFRSTATNLVSDDGNLIEDIFVRDRQLATTVRASVASSGVQADAASWSPVISGDGRAVVFTSDATNLVGDDTNGLADVFVRDLLTGTTVRASVGTGGVQGNGASGSPAISANGRWVAFVSEAKNLVPGDSTVWQDVFVRDMLTGKTELADLSTTGVQGNFGADQPALSADGRFVAFCSYSTNLLPWDVNGQIDVFVRDRQTKTLTCASVTTGGVMTTYGSSYLPVLTPDGRYVGFRSDDDALVPGDVNWVSDLFLHDSALGTTACISVDPSGLPALGGFSDTCAPSADGKHIAFGSRASNLVAQDGNGLEDVFLRDMPGAGTQLISADAAGMPLAGTSSKPSISHDGRFVAFASDAVGLDVADTNATMDIFVHDNGATSPWADVGFAKAGGPGLPQLTGSGPLTSGSINGVHLSQAAPKQPCLLKCSITSVLTPFKGGTLVAVPALVESMLFTSSAGSLDVLFAWPAGVPSGFNLWFQVITADPGATKNMSISNAVKATAP